MKRTGEGYCPKCQAWVSASIIDNGIGPYECHGYTGVHHEYVALCMECDAELEDFAEYEPEWEKDSW
jgi:hypothetical protein